MTALLQRRDGTALPADGAGALAALVKRRRRRHAHVSVVSVIALTVVAVIVLVAAIGPALSGYDPHHQDLTAANLGSGP